MSTWIIDYLSLRNLLSMASINISSRWNPRVTMYPVLALNNRFSHYVGDESCIPTPDDSPRTATGIPAVNRTLPTGETAPQEGTEV